MSSEELLLAVKKIVPPLQGRQSQRACELTIRECSDAFPHLRAQSKTDFEVSRIQYDNSQNYVVSTK
jgi:hypothetical protein